MTLEPGRVESLRLIPTPRNRSARAAPDVAGWLERLTLEGKRPRTVSAYAQTADRLLELYPNTTLGELTPADLDALLRTYATASRHIRRSHLSSLFKYAHLTRLIQEDPMPRVAQIKRPKRKQKPAFTVVEKELLMGLPSPDGPLWATLFLSGIRLGEAISLQGRHVVLDQEPDGAVTGRLLVKDGKGGKDRVVHMRKLASILNDYKLLEAVGDTDYLWYRRKYPWRKEPLSTSAFYAWMTRTMSAAGVEKKDRTVHSTRHTYAYLWIAEGGSIERLSIQLGHESIQTTFDLYVRGHMTEADVQSDLALVER